MKPFFAQIERDLLIAWQNRQDLGVMLVFFVIIIALFPLAIGANATVLDPLGVPGDLDCCSACHSCRI
jgi:heme exporter protein B